MEASSKLLSWLEEDNSQIDNLMACSKQDEVGLFRSHDYE